MISRLTIPLVTVLGIVLSVPENISLACPVTVNVVDHDRLLSSVSCTVIVYTPG